MARTAVAKAKAERSALLDAELKAMFEAVSQAPVPARFLEQIDRLQAAPAVRGAR